MTSWRLWLVRAIGLYLRNVPDHPGRWRLFVRAVKLAPALRSVTRLRVIAVRGVGRFRVDGASQTGRMLLATGEYESGSTKVMRERLEAGDRMIDVGANIGYFSIAAARVVGAKGQVVSFEPQNAVRAQLLANIALNNLSNVTVRQDALGASEGDVSFYTGPATDTGLASLRPLPGSDSVRVRQARFDDLWNGDPIRLVKIDVEGAELQVLLGMADSLDRHRPDIIMEVTDEYLRVLGDSAESLYSWLSSRGYRMYQIGLNGELDLVDGLPALARCPSQFNALCSSR